MATYSKIYSSRTNPLRRRDLLLVLVAPLIMTAVVLNHHALASTHKINPWKGGGFGMFATVDSDSIRSVYIFGLSREGFIIADPRPPGLSVLQLSQGLGDRAKALPDPRTLRKIAVEALALNAFESKQVNGAINFDGVRIQVWTLTYDAKSSRIKPKVLKTLDFFR